MLQIIQNTPIDYQVLQELYKDNEDLQKAWPGAKYPLCIDQWNEFLSKSKLNVSLLFKNEGRIVGHLVLLDKGDQQLFLCFVLLDKSLRGQGLVNDMLKQTENFVQSNFEYNELWLHVDPNNTPAFRAYAKLGYKLVSVTEAGRYRMFKKIRI